MIFVYRPQKSLSARELAMAVDGVRVKHDYNLIRRARPTDKVVMWGAFLADPGLRTTKVLNNVPLQSKFEDARRLQEAGVRTVQVSRTIPMVEEPAPPDPLIALWGAAQREATSFLNAQPNRGINSRLALTDFRGQLGQILDAMQSPAPVATIRAAEGWLPRRNDHVGGDDLLNPGGRIDYYSLKEPIVEEYRVHSFLGRSIRLGRKIPRTPQSETPFLGTPHEWIRSFEAGWQLSYADDAIPGNRKQAIRDLAHQAVQALGLHFGAVDVGALADGTLLVLEVNRAAGIEAGTTEAYARAVRRWIDGEWVV